MLNRLFIILIAISLVGRGNLFGQFKIKKKELRGEWFISNLDSNFYLSDTLTMVKRTNVSERSHKKSIYYLEREDELVGTRLCVYFGLYKNKKANIWEYLGYSSKSFIGPMKWNFKKNIVSIKSFQLDWKFEVIKMDTVEFKYKYGYTINPDTLKTYSTLKLQIVRLN